MRSSRPLARRLAKLTLSVAAALGLGLCSPTGSPRVAEATVIERVVAIVGEHAILLSELRRRSRPMLLQIQEQVPPGPQRTAYEGEMTREVLQQMVDERLMQVASERAGRRVTSEEVNQGLRMMAEGERQTVDELEQEAVASGMTPQELREQVQRQLLEQKMLSLRVLPRVRISSDDVRIGYARLLREERKQLEFRPQWVVLSVPANASPEARAERRQLAEKIVAEARAGADFADLAAHYSDDGATRARGGDLGPLKPGTLATALDEAALGLAVGEVSAPIAFGATLVILRVKERDRSKLRPLEQAHEQVAVEVYTERVQRARRQWLDELKRSVHVEIRL